MIIYFTVEKLCSYLKKAFSLRKMFLKLLLINQISIYLKLENLFSFKRVKALYAFLTLVKGKTTVSTKKC